MGMKENFFEIIALIRDTGIVDTLNYATNPQEMKCIWKKFSEENAELFERVQNWVENEYYNECSCINEFLFKPGDSIENPREITLLPYMCGKGEIPLEDLFEDFVVEMLVAPLKATGNKFADVVADYITRGSDEILSSEYIFKKLKS